MTPAQIRLVRSSYAALEPRASELGAKFYARFFNLAPETRAMFKGDISYQQKHFMGMLAEIVNQLRSLLFLPATSLENAETAIPGIHALGKRHKDFDVTPAHFASMRAALMNALAEEMGKDFTPEMSHAWLAAYDLLANGMMNALRDAEHSGTRFLKRLKDEKLPDGQAYANEFFADPTTAPSAETEDGQPELIVDRVFEQLR